MGVRPAMPANVEVASIPKTAPVDVASIGRHSQRVNPTIPPPDKGSKACVNDASHYEALAVPTY